MNRLLYRSACVVVCLAAFASAGSAQSEAKETQKGSDNVVATVTKGLGKTGVIVVKSAAKVGWEAAKFTAKEVAKPVLKAVMVKATPKISVFILKRTGVAAKHVIPRAVKLALL